MDNPIDYRTDEEREQARLDQLRGAAAKIAEVKRATDRQAEMDLAWAAEVKRAGIRQAEMDKAWISEAASAYNFRIEVYPLIVRLVDALEKIAGRE